jgi:protease-4
VKEKFVVTLLVLLFVGSLVVGLLIVVSTGSEEAKGFGASLLVRGKDAIGIVQLYSEIKTGGYSGADAVVQQLRSLEKNKHLRAIIVRINSPGGSVGATQEIHGELVRLRQEKRIKIVASVGDMGASGAYYVAAAADRIVANPGSLVGSIGVIMQIPDLSGLTEGILKVSMKTIKSGKFKDIASPFRAMTSEEETKLQEIVDDAYQQFVAAVSEGRKRVVPERDFGKAWAEAYANGLIFSGRQALEIGMVDELGGFEDAKAAARRLAGLGGDVAYISEAPGTLERLLGLIGSRAGNVERLANKVESVDQVRFDYIFKPGL